MASSGKRSVAGFAFVGLTLLLIQLTTVNGLSYFCLFPQYIRPGSDYTVSVTIYMVLDQGTANVTAEVIDNSTGSMTVIGANSAPATLGRRTGPATVLISIPIPFNLAQYQYLVQISGSGGGLMPFTNSTNVNVLQKSLSIFVQTDKATYQPGQTVLFRVVAVYPTMKPYQKSMDVYIYDPNNNLIAQWLQQQSDKGVVSNELLLSSQTTLGSWQIQVKTEVDSITKNFQVSDYVLPKFEVDVTLPSYYLLNVNKPKMQQPLPITVSSKYTYGQPVKGTAQLTASIDSGNTWQKTVELQNGQALVYITPDELSHMTPSYLTYWAGNVSYWTLLNYQTITVNANVNETLTGIVLSGSGSVTCYAEKYTLSFVSGSPTSFKPGLIYNGYVSLQQMDGSQPILSDIKLPNGKFRQITITVTNQPSPCAVCQMNPVQKNVSTTPSGFIPFSLNITAQCGVTLQASFYDASTNTTQTGSTDVSVFESIAQQGIQVSLRNPNSAIKAGDNVVFDIRATVAIQGFSYIVISKSTIVIAKTVSNINAKKTNLTLNVDTNLAQLLAPNARLVVWFVTSKSEIISDSISFEVTGAFANKVSLAYSVNQTQPRQNVSLTVRGSAGSVAYLLAVDQSVLLLSGGNDITQSMVLSDLNNYDGYFSYLNSPICFDCWWPYYPSGSDSRQVFSNAYLTFLTDGVLYDFPSWYYISPYPLPIFRKMALNEANPGGPVVGLQPTIQTRTFFPETWLWNETNIGSTGSGTIRVTAPDTITSWVASAIAINDKDGLGIAPINAKLTVFRPFFVSLALPYSVTRGEEFGLVVTVFNYLQSNLSVAITLKASPWFSVRDKSGQKNNTDVTTTVPVAANDGVTVYFWITPTKIGQIPIEVSANGGLAGDAVIMPILVIAEGIEQHYSTSVLISNQKSSDSFTTTLTATLPTQFLVPGSAQIQITVIGDFMGAVLSGLTQLIQMPYGCGEQIMITLAPDVYVLSYLTATGSLTPSLNASSRQYILSGYQSELTYQRWDGSFSAWGNSDPAGSVWLSSLVVRVFHQAKQYIPIQDSKMAETINWITSNQNGNGSFTEPPNGRIVDAYMQGGSSGGVPLTAFVVIALLENTDNSVVNQTNLDTSISNAVAYLESQLNNVNDSYSLCIVSYALVLANSRKASVALNKRDALAITSNGLKHWEVADTALPINPNSWVSPYQQSLAANVEMTAYALLTYVQQQDENGALPVASWVLSQRNPYGGFVSSQDTIVALEGLSRYATLIYAPRKLFNLQVSAQIGQESHAFTPITANDMLVLQIWEPQASSGTITINGNGIGLAVVQLNVQYNVYQVVDNSGFNLTVQAAVQNNGATVTVTTCARWLKNETCGMALETIQILSGYNFEAVDQSGARGLVANVDTDYQQVSIYYQSLDNTPTCVTVTMLRNYYVNNIQSASIKVLQYYNPNNFATATYKVQIPNVYY